MAKIIVKNGKVSVESSRKKNADFDVNLLMGLYSALRSAADRAEELADEYQAVGDDKRYRFFRSMYSQLNTLNHSARQLGGG